MSSAPAPAPVTSPRRKSDTPPQPLFAVSLGALLWAAGALLFLLVRVALTWQAPVGGAELVHLSGAWNASIGVSDDRFVATLFQALSAGLLNIEASEVPPRVLAFLATATIPAALWLLRPQLGDGGALLALVLLTFDPLAIHLGVAASAMAFDLPLAIWLFVALARPALPVWAWSALGFLVVTAGALPLTLVLAALVLMGLRRDHAYRRAAYFALPGAIAGLAVAAVGFGLQRPDALVPPFAVLAGNYAEEWSTVTALGGIALYSWPLVLGGGVCAGMLAWRVFNSPEPERDDLLLLAWAGLAFAWLLTSLTAHSTVPVVALTTPLALITGRQLAVALHGMARVDWPRASVFLSVAVLAAGVAAFYVIRWSRVNAAGDTGERLLVIAMVVVALAALAGLALRRETLGALLGVALAVALFPLLSGTFGVGLSGLAEPVPSPVSPLQARELRRLALETARERGGDVVIHATLEEHLTWPFRDSGTIVVAAGLPPGAAVLILPANAPRPEGFDVLEGNWQLLRTVDSPANDGFLRYVKWLVDRSSNPSQPLRVAVYTRSNE